MLLKSWDDLTEQKSNDFVCGHELMYSVPTYKGVQGPAPAERFGFASQSRGI